MDLVTLVFACQHKNVDRSMISVIEDCLIERTSADERRAYYAHMSLRMVDWAIRHFDDSEIETWINIAEYWRARADSTSS